MCPTHKKIPYIRHRLLFEKVAQKSGNIEAKVFYRKTNFLNLVQKSLKFKIKAENSERKQKVLSQKTCSNQTSTISKVHMHINSSI